jgi:hypothetical protein
MCDVGKLNESIANVAIMAKACNMNFVELGTSSSKDPLPFNLKTGDGIIPLKPLESDSIIIFKKGLSFLVDKPSSPYFCLFIIFLLLFLVTLATLIKTIRQNVPASPIPSATRAMARTSTVTGAKEAA